MNKIAARHREAAGNRRITIRKFRNPAALMLAVGLAGCGGYRGATDGYPSSTLSPDEYRHRYSIAHPGEPIPWGSDAALLGTGAVGGMAGQRLWSARNGAGAVEGATGETALAEAGTAAGHAAAKGVESPSARRVAARIAAAAEGDAEKQTILQMVKRAALAGDWKAAARLIAPLAAEVAEGEETIALLEVIACLLI